MPADVLTTLSPWSSARAGLFSYRDVYESHRKALSRGRYITVVRGRFLAGLLELTDR